MAGLAARKNVISKSQYLKGLQCPKALWLYRYHKELATAFSWETEQKLALGHNIGELAKQYFFEKGPVVEVQVPFWNVEEGAQLTRSFLAKAENVIFEATAIAADLHSYSRIDVLRRSSYGQVELIEVKAAKKVKAYHIEDMAFQYYVFQSAGFSVQACYMMLVDSSYVRHGELELDKFFQLCDISSPVLARQRKVLEASSQFSSMLSKRQEPEMQMGPHCSKPFECQYKAYCEGSEACLPGELFATRPALQAVGKSEAEPRITTTTKYQIQCSKLQKWLDSLAYPLFFLDYECFQSFFPLFDQSRPYQAIPFQFSLHRQDSAGEPLQHFHFLHMQQSDPRPEFIRSLLQYYGTEGSIIVYNKGFESSVNNSLARDFPDYRKALEQLNSRMCDMFLPFQKCWLYSPLQNGSASLKAVLPAFTPFSYSKMPINNGLDAMNTYRSFMLGDYNTGKVEQLRSQLQQYCQLDTRALSLLLEAMRQELDFHCNTPPRQKEAKEQGKIISSVVYNDRLLDILH